jgi:hypothetical protein
MPGRMATGGHGLPKVSIRPTMPDPSTPCGRASPETALRPFQGWPASRAGVTWPSSTHLDTPCCTPMERWKDGKMALIHVPLRGRSKKGAEAGGGGVEQGQGSNCGNGTWSQTSRRVRGSCRICRCVGAVTGKRG